MSGSAPAWDREAGYTIVDALLTAGECADVLEQCDRLFADPASAHPRDKAHSGTRHLEDLERRVPLAADLLTRPVLTDLVSNMTGRTYQSPVQVSLRAPQPGFGGQDLHRDAMDRVQGEHATVVTAIVALVEFTTDNGATRLVPGSHLTNEPAERYKGRGHSPDEITLTGPAGTAFVFSGHVLHSGTENRSQVARPALQIIWR